MTSDKATINTLIIMHKEQIVVVEHTCLLQHKAKAIKKEHQLSKSADGAAICSINIGGKH
jgi:hypothetical protein